MNEMTKPTSRRWLRLILSIGGFALLMGLRSGFPSIWQRAGISVLAFLILAEGIRRFRRI